MNKNPQLLYPELNRSAAQLERLIDDIPMDVSERIAITKQQDATIKLAFELGKRHACASMTKAQFKTQALLLTCAKNQTIRK